MVINFRDTDNSFENTSYRLKSHSYGIFLKFEGEMEDSNILSPFGL